MSLFAFNVTFQPLNLNPTPSDDVRMGRYGFLCIDCHQTKKHNIPGRAFSVSVNDNNGLRCAGCHERFAHKDERINSHFPLLDEKGTLVIESGQPYSSHKTCGACHDVSYIDTHRSHPPKQVDVDCADCHAIGENLAQIPWKTDERGWVKRESLRLGAPSAISRISHNRIGSKMARIWDAN